MVLRLVSPVCFGSLGELTAIFQCSKIYGSATHVTRLKVALNGVDSISLKENRPLAYEPGIRK